YNRMGLTTQIPKDIKVASKVKEIRTRIGNINARRVKSYVEVTNENYRMLEILDALKDFNQIPATLIKSVEALAAPGFQRSLPCLTL
ncbi:MAG: hypothetical protein ACQETC_12495, partial [Thermodesulfobacteriota bacterium]